MPIAGFWHPADFPNREVGEVFYSKRQCGRLTGAAFLFGWPSDSLETPVASLGGRMNASFQRRLARLERRFALETPPAENEQLIAEQWLILFQEWEARG